MKLDWKKAIFEEWYPSCVWPERVAWNWNALSKNKKKNVRNLTVSNVHGCMVFFTLCNAKNEGSKGVPLGQKNGCWKTPQKLFYEFFFHSISFEFQSSVCNLWGDSIQSNANAKQEEGGEKLSKKKTKNEQIHIKE